MGCRTVVWILTLALGHGCISPFGDGLGRGELAPELGARQWLNVGAGSEPSLAQWRGRPVLLEFWSKDCAPCRSHIPTVQRLAAGYAHAQLEVVSVHVGLGAVGAQDVVAIRDFVAAAKIRYPVAIDERGDLWERYQFGYLPHAVLLDEQGTVRWSGNLCVSDVERPLFRQLGPPAAAVGAIELTDPSELDGIHLECEAGVCRAPN